MRPPPPVTRANGEPNSIGNRSANLVDKLARGVHEVPPVVQRRKQAAGYTERLRTIARTRPTLYAIAGRTTSETRSTHQAAHLPTSLPGDGLNQRRILVSGSSVADLLRDGQPSDAIARVGCPIPTSPHGMSRASAPDSEPPCDRGVLWMA
jgi:hypothetical protein